MVEELLKHLRKCMQDLESKVINIDEAKAQASLVKQANNLLRYDLDERKFKHKQEVEKENSQPA